jgi:hypothetical protein
MSGTRTGYHSFWIKFGAALVLVALGDALFYQMDRGGSTIGVFAGAWLVAALAASRAMRHDKRALVCLGAAGIFAAALAIDPSLLAWLLFWTALSMAALLPGTAAFDDGWRWLQRLVVHGCGSLVGPAIDSFKLRRLQSFPSWQHGMRSLLPILVLPLIGSAVILTLFSAANPVIGDMLSRLSLPALSASQVFRAILWAMLFTVVWGAFRPRRTNRLLATFDGTGDLDLPGVNVRSILLSLALFNLLFLLQNALDIAYLWGGVPLPDGMTLAEYAHRGAYPLIGTALLAGGFVIVTLRPGSRTASHPHIRTLLVLWIGQNIFLVASTMLRTLDYVEAYSLTRLRIAALVWMTIVAIGLALICWRMLRSKSTSWLINTNGAVAAFVLAAFCFVDTGAMAAAWNVRHAREVGGKGAALDLCYLNSLGGSALLSLVHLEQQRLAPRFAARVQRVRHDVLGDVSREQQNGSWTVRNALRLHEAKRRLGNPARLAGNNWDCAGRLIRPVSSPAPPAPLTAPAAQ